MTEGIRAVPLAYMLKEAPAGIRAAVGLRIGEAGDRGPAGRGRGRDRSDGRRRGGPEGSREAAGRAAWGSGRLGREAEGENTGALAEGVQELEQFHPRAR